MARTPNQEQQPFENLPIDPLLSQNQEILSSVMNEYNDNRDLANVLLGQAQMSDAFKKLSKTVWISKLDFVKKNKLYRSFKGKKTPNGLVLSGTWKEYCSLLNVSEEKANQDIANFTTFGEEALEAMQNVGIGYREFTQLRKLPEDAKAELIEVAKEGDKSELLSTAQNLIAKQAIEKEEIIKEKESLNKQLQDTKLDLESSRKLLSNKDSRINELSSQLEKKALIEPPSVDEQIKQLRHEINLIAFEAESIIRGKLRVGFEKLNSEYGSTEREVMAGWIGNIRSALNQLAGEFDLPEIPDEFAWAKE